MTKRSSYHIKHDVFYSSKSSALISKNGRRLFNRNDCSHYKEPISFYHFFDKPRYVLLSELALINEEKQLTSFLNKTCWIKEMIIIDDITSSSKAVIQTFKTFLINQISSKLLENGLKTILGTFC